MADASIERYKNVYVDGNIIITCKYKCADLVSKSPKCDSIIYDDEKVGDWIVYREDMMDENTVYYASKGISQIKPFNPSSIDEIYNLYKYSIGSLEELVEYDLPEKLSYTRYKCAYSGVFAAMEFFMYNVCKFYILRSDEYGAKFLKIKFNDKKMVISEIFDEYKNLNKYIDEKLSSIVYHNMGKVCVIFKDVFDIDIDIKEISEFANIRHDIIHRDGRTKDGNMYYVTKNLLSDLITCSNNMVEQIFNDMKYKNK